MIGALFAEAVLPFLAVETDTSSLPVCFVAAALSTFGTVVRESFPPGGSHFRLRRQ